MSNRTYYVYILTNLSRTLYIGMTNSLERRIYEHRMKAVRGFTQRYNVTMLVYVEAFERPMDAIEREKQLKRWSRAKKVALIETLNPCWEDLSAAWFTGQRSEQPDDV
ncbi:MAG: endonuclease [Chloroflexi bacterium]|nr:MAG: endonuclease [Chloroflexota bacterium]